MAQTRCSEQIAHEGVVRVVSLKVQNTLHMYSKVQSQGTYLGTIHLYTEVGARWCRSGLSRWP